MQRHYSPLWLWALLLVPLWPAAARAVDAVDVEPTRVGNLTIRPLTHASVLLQWRGKVVYADPAGPQDWSSLPKADLIVITHTHADHLDRSMVDRLHKPDTLIVGPPAVIDTLNCAPACGRVETIGEADHQIVLGIGIQGVPMYNIVHGSAPSEPYHHRGVGSGYVLDFAGTRVYISGDSECTPEMKQLRHITIAFLAMNPPRTSSPQEVALCARAFRPGIVYPYHYRGSNPQEFADALRGSGIEVRIRQLEGELR